jgi:RNA recognition motif-containing protein
MERERERKRPSAAARETVLQFSCGVRRHCTHTLDSPSRFMNVLTQIKATARASEREAAAGIGPGASWHAAFRHSAYIFVGGLPQNLTEGDILAVFAQYGEIVDIHLCR